MRKFSLCIFYLAPVIDSITGYYMGISGEDNNISKIYRTIAFAVLYMFYCCAAGIRKVGYQIAIVIYVVFLIIYYRLHGGNVFVDSSYIIKLFYPILLVSVSMILFNRRQLGINDIYHIIDYYSLVYPGSIIVSSLLGIGHSTYGGYGENGYMGLFSGGNEISIVLAILFMIGIQSGYSLKNIRRITVKVIFLGFSLLMTQTKMAYIIVATTLVLFIVLNVRNNPKKLHRSVMIIAVIIICLVVYAYSQQEQIMIMTDRLTFKYKQLGNSFVNMLFSNRQNKIIPIMKENYSINIKGIENFLFGQGFYVQVLKEGNGTFGLVEMDLADILFQNGIIILCIVLRFYWNIAMQAVKSRDFFIVFIYMMAMLYSTLAGHVLYNPLSSTTLAVLCIYVNANRNPLFNYMRKCLTRRKIKK